MAAVINDDMACMRHMMSHNHGWQGATSLTKLMIEATVAPRPTVFSWLVTCLKLT
jgi:hypothetical protein